MRTRLRVGHVMVLGPHLMRELASFHRGGSCAAAVPASSPYYQILGMAEEKEEASGAITFVYALVPLDLHSIFGWSNIEFEWDPNVSTGVIAYRLQAPHGWHG